MLLQAMYNLRIKQFDWNNMMHLNVAVSCCMERFSIDSCEAFKSILTLVGTVWLGNQLYVCWSQCGNLCFGSEEKDWTLFYSPLDDQLIKIQ